VIGAELDNAEISDCVSTKRARLQIDKLPVPAPLILEGDDVAIETVDVRVSGNEWA